MKKFTSLMLMLLCTVTAWAQTLPQMSTDGDIKWYTIKNIRTGNFVTYASDAANMTQQSQANANSFFYFTAAEGGAEGFTAVKIHNYGTENLLTNFSSWTAEGATWYLAACNHETTHAGLHITTTTSLADWNAWNAYGSTTIGDYYSDDDGSVFEITEATDFTAVIDIPAVKTAAIAEIQLLATATAIYPATAETEAAINAVTPAGTGIAELNAALEEIKALVAAYKTNAYQALEGKYFSIKTPARTNGYLEMGALQVNGAAALASPATAWKFVENNGKVNIYNEYTKKYLCEPAGDSETVAVTLDQASAGAYDLLVNSTDNDSDGAVIKLTSNSKSTHLDGGGKLVRWDNGGASEFNVVELVDTDLASIATAYKATVVATLDDWATLTVVFDAALIADAKAAINAVTSTGFEACAAYDAELKKVTDAVAAKMFTFQTTATDNNRNGVWVSANASTMKAIGADTQDYNAIWSLRHAGGTSFYMYNELNSVYMGAPSSNCPLTATPSAAYTFEIVDAENGIVEMKCNGETLHASNHTDDKLLNYDHDQDASRWYIRTIDIAADIQTILDGLTEADYAEVPALGQYTKAAYDALVEARTSARTVAEVEAAIAAFNKSRNIPVYFIRSAHDGYAAGSAIYYDGAWKWKTANKYDKQMWMTIPAYAQANVPAVDAYDSEGTSYEICDYLTGTVMRGKSVQIVAIDGLENAYNLQYNADANSTDATQHAKDTKELVNWKPATATDNLASAWYVDYLGTSFELDQLTDEKIAALVALQTAYDAKAFYADAVMGDGLGEYTGNKDAIVAALPAAETIGAKTLAEQAVLSIDDINAATDALNNVAALAINLPVQGKYYRIQGACEASLKGYYITGHTNADGGRIALTENADASTIYYFDGTNLIAYESGLVVGLNSSNWTFASIDDNSKPASTITFAQSPRTVGAYTVKSADRYFHYTVYNGTVQVNRCSEDIDKEHDWYLTEVTTLPVTVTAAGYATFFAPVEVTVPEGTVTAHTVTIDGEWASLSEEPLTTIPANTGVVLANAGEVELAINYEGTAAAIEGNVLEGTVATEYVAANAYVLANGEAGIGFYKAALNKVENTKFQNNGHKAYLVVDGADGAAYYSFRFPGTTGVDQITDNREQSTVIYDLTGRRVEAITAPGIYIVNGKKVLVK